MGTMMRRGSGRQQMHRHRELMNLLQCHR